MSTVNTPESTERPEGVAPDESVAPEEGAASTDGADASDSGPSDAAEDGAPRSTDTSIYVRRSRVPALGFWVALAIAVPSLVALVISPFLDFTDAGGALGFVLLVAAFVGIPLAAIAAAVDSALQRRASRRRR
ncbi:hypothetical protein [Brachybacterium sp. YJGR34]|uniref:hypothetical protein n=1 Tax=Brachybacterium sp. YJGR34 TaxID=2059911 RepID=UPI0013006971|nr:hypothetical protein [Brachybacterium sp. YJGR34]